MDSNVDEEVHVSFEGDMEGLEAGVGQDGSLPCRCEPHVCDNGLEVASEAAGRHLLAGVCAFAKVDPEVGSRERASGNASASSSAERRGMVRGGGIESTVSTKTKSRIKNWGGSEGADIQRSIPVWEGPGIATL